jgi:hypothetical protein
MILLMVRQYALASLISSFHRIQGQSRHVGLPGCGGLGFGYT